MALIRVPSGAKGASLLDSLAARLKLRPFVVLLLACSLVALSDAAEQANPKRYVEDVKVLTTPEMQGRGDGTKGLSRAAKYIERQFKRLGLEPARID